MTACVLRFLGRSENKNRSTCVEDKGDIIALCALVI